MGFLSTLFLVYVGTNTMDYAALIYTWANPKHCTNFESTGDLAGSSRSIVPLLFAFPITVIII